MTPRSRCATVVAGVAALALTGCAPGPGPIDLAPGDGSGVVSIEYLEKSDSPNWHVFVAYPAPYPDDDGCAGDPSIELGTMSMDAPSSRLSYKLYPDATADAADRIADCLLNTLSSGAISVSPPK